MATALAAHPKYLTRAGEAGQHEICARHGKCSRATRSNESKKALLPGFPTDLQTGDSSTERDPDTDDGREAGTARSEVKPSKARRTPLGPGNDSSLGHASRALIDGLFERL